MVECVAVGAVVTAFTDDEESGRLLVVAEVLSLVVLWGVVAGLEAVVCSAISVVFAGVDVVVVGDFALEPMGDFVLEPSWFLAAVGVL